MSEFWTTGLVQFSNAKSCPKSELLSVQISDSHSVRKYCVSDIFQGSFITDARGKDPVKIKLSQINVSFNCCLFRTDVENF